MKKPNLKIKPMMAWLFSLLVCAGLYQNCGGRFQSEEMKFIPEAAAVGSRQPEPDSYPTEIGYYGDSTVEGIGPEISKAAPVIFDENISEVYVTTNEGAGGATVLKLLEGRDHYHPEWEIEMTQSKAKYIIMNYALNEINEVGNSLDRFKGNYSKAIDIARVHGKYVILETPNPTNYSEILKPWVEAIKQVAVDKDCPLIDQFAYLNDYMSIHHLTVSNLTLDGVHPTQEGHRLKGEFAAMRFKEILNSQ